MKPTRTTRANSSLIAQPLAPYKLIVCASPDYLAQRGTPQTLDDLVSHDCLAYSHGNSSMPCRWIFSRQGFTQEVQVIGRLRSDNWKALLHAATEEFGITMGPRMC